MVSGPAKAIRELKSKVLAKFRGGSITSKTAGRWLLRGLVPVLLLFFGLACWRGWTTAYLVLIGSMTPGEADAAPVALLLSLAGYALVPLVIGASVAGYFARAVEHAAQTDFNAQVQHQLDELVASGKYVVVTQQPQAVTGADGFHR